MEIQNALPIDVELQGKSLIKPGAPLCNSDVDSLEAHVHSADLRSHGRRQPVPVIDTGKSNCRFAAVNQPAT